MLTRYTLGTDPKTPGEGWAHIVIDTAIGFFATVSDFGNYACEWTAPGGEFRKFLLGVSFDRMHDKLMLERPDRSVFDGERTKAAILEDVRSEMKVSAEDKDVVTRARWVREHELITACEMESVSDFDAWMSETTIDDAWEYHRTVPQPQCRRFCEEVMPRFKAILRAELDAEASLPVPSPTIP